MTLAICLKCGAQKQGAWTRCEACHFEPSSSEEKAKSIALSDHNQSPDELQLTSERIQAGQPLLFDDDGLQRLAMQIELSDHNDLFCALFPWALIAIMFLLLAFNLYSCHGN